MDAAPIQARRLEKSFGTTPVLRGVNLRVAAGAATVIIGRNGAGKSTLLRILSGLSTPGAGEALLFGFASRNLSPELRRKVGIITDQSFLYPNLTASENLEFYASLYRIDDARNTVARWLERVGLAARRNERVRTFSSGMQQRLALARAMLATPEVLLMDEPFAALDRDGVALVVDLVMEAMARGCAILMTAHAPLALGGTTVEQFEIVRGRLNEVAANQTAARPMPVMAN